MELFILKSLVIPLEMSRPFDKLEKSPTSQAKCRICNAKIGKGEWRIGEHYLYRKLEKWSVKWYHRSCVEADKDVLNSLNFPSKHTTSKRKYEEVTGSPNKVWIQMEANEIKGGENKKQRLVHHDRGSLREELRQLRLQFAKSMDVPPYIIFNNDTLDDLVETMPSSENELLKVKGIGPKKISSFGSSILSTIASYRISCGLDESPRSDTRQVKSARRRLCYDSDASDDSDEDSIEVEKELSVDDIVEKRFKEAEEKGNVIVL